jgi:hypothetical protein
MSPPFAQEWSTRKPYSELHPHFMSALGGLSGWPEPETYDELSQRVPLAPGLERPRFVREDRQALRRLGGYERHVAELRAVPTRPQSWHDFFNMVVWAHFPALRWALNALHVDPNAGPIDARNGRSPAQNLAATFDESGAIVLSTSPALLSELRGLRFRQAFWHRRAELLATTRVWVVGHGLLEALLVRRQGLVARALLLQVPALPEPGASDAFRFDIDTRVASTIATWRAERTVLDPLPVLAFPGFDDNDCVDFYDDLRNLRFEPVSRRPLSPGLP